MATPQKDLALDTAEHVAVLAPSAPVESPPPSGPLVILPTSSDADLNAARKLFTDSTEAAGGQIAPLSEKTRGILWLNHSAKRMDELKEALESNPGIGFVQLPLAGVDKFAALMKAHPKVIFTSAKGAYAMPVAEHALALTLGLLRVIPLRVRATSWGPSAGTSLFRKHVVCVGGGGITLALISLLSVFRCKVTVLRRSSAPLDLSTVAPSFADSVTTKPCTKESLNAILPTADVVVVAAAYTPETRNLFSHEVFKAMKKEAVLVNVARGELVDTDALVQALEQGEIGGAGLDVTAPEPLPKEHKLWSFNQPDSEHNLIITPHTADTAAMVTPLLAQRIKDNVRALVEEKGAFTGVVDTEQGY